MLKKNLLLVIAFSFFLLSSCEKDENVVPDTETIENGEDGNSGDGNDDPLDVDTPIVSNPDEEKAISNESLNSGIIVNGATKTAGTPPAPTNNIDFQISTEENEAYQKAGFNINFSSTDEIAGAYIQFKDVDGTPIDGYFDVPASTFETEGSSKKINTNSTKSSKVSRSAKSLEDEDDTSIDVDFEESLPVGRFCYDICLYDSANNISSIVSVCVTVEAWGGNSEIVGEWIYNESKSDSYDDDYKVSLICNDQSNIEADYEKVVSSEWTFVLNEDGTYYEIYDDSFYELNYDETEAQCNAVYSDDLTEENEKYSGNWAYNEEVGTMTAVDFLYENLTENITETFDNGGSLYFEGVKVEVISGQLVITDQDGGEEFKSYFDRK